MRLVIPLAWAALVLPLPDAAGAQAGTRLTGLRAWSSPQVTRVVFDLSEPSGHVAPDSGSSASVTVSLPGASRSESAPAGLAVADSVVESVRVEAAPHGLLLTLHFPDVRAFRVFTLEADEGKPYRIVVDVERPGGRAQVERTLKGIAELKAQRTRVVAVDAGHGGEDGGARGPRGVLEKHVTLAVARALVQELNRMPGVRGALIREGDYFIPLQDRYRMAERMKADLFISIHANSSPRRTRGRNRGTEVFFLSLRGASDQASKDLADTENAADLVGGLPAQAEDDLVSILYDVKRTSALQHSQLLAENILDRIADDRRLESRGVKQAAFAVLKSVEFPSVLVETAFINNPTEARLLRDPAFQRQMARQIAAGVRLYLERLGVSIGGTPTGARVAPSGPARSQRAPETRPSSR